MQRGVKPETDWGARFLYISLRHGALSSAFFVVASSARWQEEKMQIGLKPETDWRARSLYNSLRHGVSVICILCSSIISEVARRNKADKGKAWNGLTGEVSLQFVDTWGFCYLHLVF